MAWHGMAWQAAFAMSAATDGADGLTHGTWSNLGTAVSHRCIPVGMS